ncbi:translocation/assembly module TamB domain-containing protein [Granulosicoccus antarcticus]|uniref:Translocation and assembly module TamB n=1 Tax=Granulosicoccus antarcticus IMCC3135 TaxID=1192854 RepID=A0A2Z2NWC6_9GAMM|nr:translocation/assembly module TamB domain-containing protein [Granulosicoccus antarcticus]ASJ74805.1 Translocation and assembly module TamB [Granulosicoccus antarcticus IMCC3135]
MIKRILKRTSLFLLLLILLIVGGISWIVGTESGFQQALALGKKFAPGTLEWDEADGKLIGPLRVRGFHYLQEGGIEARLGALDFDWRPSALFGSELAVDQLHLDGVEVHLAESAAEPEETSSGGELPDISLPVSISLADISVTNVAIFPAGQETAIEISSVALAASAEQSDVNLKNLDVIAPQGELHLAGKVQTSGDYPMDLTVSWQADIAQPSPLQGKGTLVGNLTQLQIDHQIAGFAMADIAATVSNVMQAPAWNASVEASLPNPESLSELLSGTPQITLKSSGTPDAYEAQATVNVTTTETGPVTVDADVNGSTEMLDIRSLIVRLSENGGELSASGQLAFATLEGDIQGQWQALSWPLEGEPQFTSPTGSFDVKGSLEKFKASLNTSVDGEAIPEGQWTVSLDGSATELSNFEVQGQTLDGTIAASGTASWENQPDWDVELVTEGINPGEQWSEFPGRINLDVSSKGQISDSGPQLTAQINQLSGRLREQPLAGSGSVRLDGEKLNIDNLIVTHGPSQLDANGQIDDQIALDFELDSPDLGTLMPELAGAISMSGNISGSKEAPMLNASGSANNVVYAENSVSKLDFSVDGGLAASVVSTLAIEASGITAGGQEISDIKLDGQGTQTKHSLVLSAETDQGDLVTQLDGGYESDTWNGFLSSLQLENTPAGNWGLREPVAISANAQKADVAQLCLDNSDKLGNICLLGNWLAEGDSNATLSISGLSPELAEAYLPPGLLVETELNADATAALGSDGSVNAEARIVLDSGKLTLNADTSPVEIGLEQTSIDATLRDNDATFDLATAFTDFGNLNVKGAVSELDGEGNLSGTLDADFPDLTLISAFAPQIQQVSGALKSNLSLGGTLETPQVEGELALVDFTAEIPETAMLIEDTQLSITGNPDGTMLIKGQSSSGEGQLDIEGDINPGTQALNISINGEQYQVANTSLMQAVISPELDIAMDDTGMRVNGKVTIPSAYINANGGNEGIKTVSSSSDVVYVSEEGEQAETPPSQLNLDVQIILGDSVEVEAGDFRGRLEGDLRVQQTPELAPRGTGTINVLNGDYVIYGQQLDMERGRILFSGGPVDNPSLDMQVARTVQEYDVVAGAKIQGTAQSPRLELYSDPPMPDASILSYILLGQPPGTTGGSYTLGKYLTPDLYVSYGIGLFDAINTFNMRYKLTDKLALEAESGSGSSADLIYTIEK